MTQGHEDGGATLEAIVHEHCQLRILVQAAIQDVERTDLLSLALVAPLAEYLLAHFRREETELFPLAERLVGDPRFPKTAALRREHLVLRELLHDIEAALTHRDRAGARGNLLELAASLRLHCAQEVALYNLDTAQCDEPSGPSAAALRKDKLDGT